MAFDTSGGFLVSADDGLALRVWNVKTGTEVRSLRGHTGQVTGLAFAPKGQLASASVDGTVKFWDSTTSQEFRTIARSWGRLPLGFGLVDNTPYQKRIALSPDGLWLATISAYDKLQIWDVGTGKKLHSLGEQNSSEGSPTFSPDGRFLAWSNYVEDKKQNRKPQVQVWDETNGRVTLTIPGQGSVCDRLAFSPDGKRLAGAAGGKVKIWDTTSGQELLTSEGTAALLGTSPSVPTAW